MGLVKRINSWSTKKKIITIVILLCVAALIFGVEHFLWRRHIENTFTPFLQTGRMELSSDHDGRRTYQYWDDENDYIAQITIPPYLVYEGQMLVTALKRGDSVFAGSFRVTYIREFHEGRLQLRQQYLLSISESTGAFSSYWLGMRTDKNGRPLINESKNTAAQDEAFMVLYEKYQSEITAMIKYFKDFFGG